MTAARLYGLWLPDRPNERIEVIVHPDQGPPPRRAGGTRAEVRARRQLLRTDEVGFVGGLPVTTVARTWVHVAAQLSLPDLVAAGDCALRGLTTLPELTAQVARAAHSPGVIRAREALALLDARSRSRPESHMRCAIVSAGLPRPEVNVEIRDCFGQWVAEPDLSYDDVRLAIEYNGADHVQVRRMRGDITRTLDVERRGGWRVVVFGPAEVFGRPDEVAAHVRWLRGAHPRSVAS